MQDTAMDARVLGQLLLMQSVMINLPDEEAILAFACRGLADIPGVWSVTHDPASREAGWLSTPGQDGGRHSSRIFPLRAGQSGHGALALAVSDGELLEPYVAYLNNFCFMLAVILEERGQRRLIETHKAWLEERMEERSAELRFQVERIEAAESVIRKGEESFRELMELAPEAIVVMDVSSDRPAMANRKAEELFGCSRQDLLEKGYHRFYRADQPDGRPISETIPINRARALAGKEAVFERAIRNARGEDLHCEVRLVRLPSAGGNLLRASWVDITARKKLETAQRQSEERFRAMAEASISGFWVVGTDGVIKESNESYARISGYSRGELAGMPISTVEVEENQNQVRERALRLVQNGSDRFETRHRAKDGRILDVEVSIVYVPEHDEFMVFLHNITPRKQAEAVLNARLDLARKSEGLSLDDLLQYTLDEAERLTGATIGFFHLVDVDQRHLQLHSWSSKTLSWCTAKGKGSHYPLEQAGMWADCLRLGRPVTHNDFQKETGRRGYPQGHVHVVNELTLPIYRGCRAVAIMGVGNKEGDFTARDAEVVEQLANLCWEVVSRKRAEENVLRSLEEKTVLLKEVHHRVKNNLQILMSLIDLQADTLTGEDSLQAFRLMQNRVRSIALAHERLYRSPDLGAVQMREYLGDLVDQVAASHLAASGIRTQVNVEDLTLGVDRAIPLGLLVTELVTNAYKHAFKGREKGKLQVGMACQDAHCLLTVEDDGPGLPASFEAEAGPSLGMQLVRALAGQLGGALRVEQGPGARFDLEFPLKPGEGSIADGPEDPSPPAK
jgi:PAS domain S-box-containing protein